MLGLAESATLNWHHRRHCMRSGRSDWHNFRPLVDDDAGNADDVDGDVVRVHSFR